MTTPGKDLFSASIRISSLLSFAVCISFLWVREPSFKIFLDKEKKVIQRIQQYLILNLYVHTVSAPAVSAPAFSAPAVSAPAFSATTFLTIFVT